ncbi:MFS transporter [Celerinatantimonas yamalensis]|uniref:MFS transporter n=1 Tax=Celerinatantimonas yamalensis TaxID=559956 RepID=A0ABW9G3P1_9GAMM
MVKSKRSVNSHFAMAVLAISLFLVYMTANAPTPLYSLWQQSIHYSATGISVIFVVYHLGIVCSLLLMRRVQTARTTMRLLSTALITAIIAAVLFASADQFWQLVTARVLIGLGCGVFISCGISLIVRIGLTQHIINTPLLVTLSCVLGFGLGPFYAGIIADIFPTPFRWIFYPLIVALIICFFLLRQLAPSSSITQLTHNEDEQTKDESPRNYPLFFVATALFASPFALAGLFISLGPSMMSESMHTTNHALIGFVPLLMFGSGVISQICLRALSISKQILIGIIGTFLGGVGVLVAEVHHWIILMIIAAILTGIAQSMTQLAGIRLLKEFQPLGSFQRSTSTFFLCGYLYAAFSIFVMGWVASHMGLQVGSQVFLYLCFMLMAAATGGYLIIHQSKSN